MNGLHGVRIVSLQNCCLKLVALKHLCVERVSGEYLSGIRTLATGLSAGPAVRAGAASARALRSPRCARRAAAQTGWKPRGLCDPPRLLCSARTSEGGRRNGFIAQRLLSPLWKQMFESFVQLLGFGRLNKTLLIF